MTSSYCVCGRTWWCVRNRVHCPTWTAPHELPSMPVQLWWLSYSHTIKNTFVHVNTLCFISLFSIQLYVLDLICWYVCVTVCVYAQYMHVYSIFLPSLPPSLVLKWRPSLVLPVLPVAMRVPYWNRLSWRELQTSSLKPQWVYNTVICMLSSHDRHCDIMVPYTILCRFTMKLDFPLLW